MLFSPAVFREVERLLKKHMPDTYACDTVLCTEEFGELPIAKEKGEGSFSSLSERIGNNYYNTYIR